MKEKMWTMLGYRSDCFGNQSHLQINYKYVIIGRKL